MGPNLSRSDLRDRVAALAGKQHGVIARAQLLGLGTTPSAAKALVRALALKRLFVGVYALPSSRATFERKTMAAVLAAGPESAVSHRAAAKLHRLVSKDDCVSLSVPTTRRPRLRSWVRVFRVARLPEEHLTKVSNIPVTRVARTIWDLATILERGTLELALDRALKLGKTGVEHLLAVGDELGESRTGAHVLRELLRERHRGRALVESPLEQMVRDLLRAEGIGGWTNQLDVELAPGVLARLDIPFPKLLLALEPEGYEFHSGREQWKHDRTRQAKLAALGWRTFPITWEDVHEGRNELVARIRAAVAAPSCVAR